MSARPILLLIDDDRDYVDVIERAFTKAAMSVELRVVRDGQEALDVLGLEDDKTTRERLPQVVFLDLRMPRVDGWEVLRRLRSTARTSRLPVVVVSGSDRPEDIERSYALGANSYLLKRSDFRSPGSNLAEAARYWIEMNQVPAARELMTW